MEEWKEYKLGEVINILDYKRIPLSSAERKTREGGFPYYGAQGIIDYIDDYIFDGTYLLIAEDGENLKSKKQDIAQLAHGKYWVNNHAHIVESNGICDIRYLCYILNNIDLSGYITGSAQPKLNQANLSAISIILPPLNLQEQIADFISMFDNKIELNQRINDNLEQQAQALFKSWFVDFEPFKDGKFVESELGRIPEGWRVERLGSVCKCLLGGTPSRNKGEYWNGKIAWINSGEINEFRITKPSEYITQEGLKKSATKLLPKKTTVLAITGATLGQVSLLEINSCANQSVIGVLENEDIFHEYIYPLIKNRIDDLCSHMTGGAQQHINKNNVEQLEILIPPKKILIEYKRIATPIYSLISNICFESQKISKLRDSLLPRLMSGELKLDNINN